LRAAAVDQERQLIIHERRAIVKQEIRLLPPLFRTVVLLHDVYELPLADIADRLNITVSAIKSRLVRARAELRERVVRRYDWSAQSPQSFHRPPDKHASVAP
jgi:RNA polymerase sigma-70 factor (ECF subfamily)